MPTQTRSLASQFGTYFAWGLSIPLMYALAIQLGIASGYMIAALTISAPLMLFAVSRVYSWTLNAIFSGRNPHSDVDFSILFGLSLALLIPTAGLGLMTTLALGVPFAIEAMTATYRFMFAATPNDPRQPTRSQEQNSDQEPNRNRTGREPQRELRRDRSVSRSTSRPNHDVRRQNEDVRTTRLWGQLINQIRENQDNNSIERTLNQILARTNFCANPGIIHAGIEAINQNNNHVLELIAGTRQLRNYLQDYQNRLLRQACFRGRTEFVRALLQNHYVAPTAGELHNEALRHACSGGHTEIVRLLLAQPSVIDNITYNNNEALRVAAERGHFEIVEALLTIPAVANFEIRPGPFLTLRLNPNGPTDIIPALNIPHRVPVVAPVQPVPPFWGNNQGQDLRTIAENNENAMRALDANQIALINEVYADYRDDLEVQGIDGVLGDIRNYLERKYRREPVVHHNRPLPIEHRHNLTPAENILYYQNKTHTAYRYLFLQPNPWANNSFSNISDADRTKIALMWLLANDEEKDLPPGFTRESIREQFISSLADCCRAHNWDNQRETRSAAGERVLEYYDDLQPDRNTCPMGVGQRVVQFLMIFMNDLPQLRPLTTDIVKVKLKEELIRAMDNNDHTVHARLSALNKQNFDNFKDAYDSWMCEHLMDRTALSEDEEQALQQIVISDEGINQFIRSCEHHFGRERIQTPFEQPIVYNGNQCRTYPDFIRAVAANYLVEYYQSMSDILTAVSSEKNKEKSKSSSKKVEQGKTKSKSKVSADKEKTTKTSKALIIKRPKVRAKANALTSCHSEVNESSSRERSRTRVR